MFCIYIIWFSGYCPTEANRQMWKLQWLLDSSTVCKCSVNQIIRTSPQQTRRMPDCIDETCYLLTAFLPRDAYAYRGLCRGKMSVRSSVCPLHADILPKRLETAWQLIFLLLNSLFMLCYAFNLLIAFDRLLLKGLLTYLLKGKGKGKCIYIARFL